MTAEEREAWLDHLVASDDPSEPDEEYEDFDPLTAEELAGIGPVDPWLARDLAIAAAASPKTTWCIIVTGEHGHAAGHGCARPGPKRHRNAEAQCSW